MDDRGGDDPCPAAYTDGQRTLAEIPGMMADIEAKGLITFPSGDLVMFRRFELVAAINRLRSLKVQ